MSLFKKAAQCKLRFKGINGLMNVEDLYDLPLTSGSRNSLDNLAKSVNKILKESEEESFVTTASKVDSDNTLRLDLLKEIIADKVAEDEKTRTSVEKKQQKETLLKLLANKQEEEQGALSKEEIEKQLKELEA